MSRLPSHFASCAGLALLCASISAQIVFDTPRTITSVLGELDVRQADIAATDVDGDGNLDVVFSDNVVYGLQLTTHLGRGDGTFDLYAQDPTLLGLRLLAAGDVTGDGLGDAFATDEVEALFLRSIGGGMFSPEPILPGVLPERLWISDLDGDGSPDLVVVGQPTAPDLTVALGAGDGTFAIAWQIALPPPGETKLGVLADLDGDGVRDLVLALGPDLVLFGGIDGGTSPPVPVLLDVAPADLREFDAADIDDDGNVDLVLATSDRIVLALNAGDGSIASQVEIAPFGLVRDLLACDIDADGRSDILYLNSLDELVVLRGLDGLAFKTLRVSHMPRGDDLVVGDFDGGRPDVFASAQLDAYGSSDDDLRFIPNRTYPYGTGSPFLDLGFPLAGQEGWPIQLADGSLHPGSTWSLQLCNALPSGLAAFVIGGDLLGMKFRGGMLVPSPDVIVWGLPVDPTGRLVTTGVWPGTPSGLTFFVQWWIADPGGPQGWAASPGLRVRVP
ncbi:MAG: VCBS repeat-containing protein [Planctomycetes bacterium]|nr:VCBS repeat-containing protein [Planctomycetota bacterium]